MSEIKPEIKFRPKYHKGANVDGRKSVALESEAYYKLKDKADELGVTIKSLLAVLIARYIDDVKEE